MRESQRTIATGMLLALALGAGAATVARGDVLTADQAVRLALAHNSSIVEANASVLDARSGVYRGYSGVLPSVTGTWTRDGSLSRYSSGVRFFGSTPIPTAPNDAVSYSTTPGLSGRWSVLDLSSLQGLQAARTRLRAAGLQREATRATVVEGARRQYYEVVKAIKLAEVAGEALKLARDDERRVRALFEVGSVAKSDLLTAQVATAQAQLDSLNARQTVVVQRIGLATTLGIEEQRLGDVDTTLSTAPQNLDEQQLFDEARRRRPDLLGAEAALRSARQSVRAANLSRLPFVTLSGSTTFFPRSSSEVTNYRSPHTGRDTLFTTSGRSTTDRTYSGEIALNWNLFTGFGTESDIATSKAGLLRQQEAYDALRRNLLGEVHEALLGYRASAEQLQVAESGLASADESLRLTQQKYNVGSATILDLVNAQVQLQRAQSNRVSALAAILQAEATLDRVRGRTE